MTKEEINKTIFSLQSEEEIIDFVKSRIQELEDASVESTVGQGYTTTFREYISSKTHYKPGAKLQGDACPDLVYDDLTPYVDLIKDVRREGGYDEFTLLTRIFFEVYNYLPNEDEAGLERNFLYLKNKDKYVSIREVRDEACAVCAEKAGLAHNLFKFLGIDSEVVAGYRDSEKHAYNIMYPNGYDNEPAILYDPSFFVNFANENHKYSFGYYKVFKGEDCGKLMSGVPMKIDLSSTERNYRQCYGFGDDYSFTGDTPSYTVGLDRKMEMPGQDINDELYYSTHLENGVESVDTGFSM